MKKLLLVTCALAAISLLAPSTGVAQPYYNQFGIYTTQDADPNNVNYTGAAGQVTAYVVVTNPRNYHLGDPNSTIEQDIAVVGGFEFKIIVPGSVFLLAADLPPLTVNFHTSPNFLCGTNLPVTNGKATCLTLNIGAFSVTPALFYLSPVDDVPSIPGYLAITDYNDDFRLNSGHPASGSFDAPVFGLWADPAVVDAEDASWGELKSLYR